MLENGCTYIYMHATTSMNVSIPKLELNFIIYHFSARAKLNLVLNSIFFLMLYKVVLTFISEH